MHACSYNCLLRVTCVSKSKEILNYYICHVMNVVHMSMQYQAHIAHEICIAPWCSSSKESDIALTFGLSVITLSTTLLVF